MWGDLISANNINSGTIYCNEIKVKGDELATKSWVWEMVNMLAA